ncbi:MULTISPECIES: hypothetical protein [unclassified Streptomyces]|uniref:hypothetical protein n=1 Tax=unclassified Streptomyces TaxID=2593676 RepID=UPI001488A8E7|nr:MULTISPECIES: hypothetical protein [unclassified Streptomyces]
MNAFIAAVTGAGTAVAVGLVAIARATAPTGRHRAPRRAPADVEPLRPVEALDQFEAYCPAEDRPTLQLRMRLGGTCCTECRNDTTSTTTGGNQ